MNTLLNCEPKRVLYYFEQLCAIPHGSGNCGAISAYCVKVATELGLPVTRDKWDNVIIKKAASPGYENHEAVILQGHLDMVCEKDADCPIDFEKDGLDLFTEDGWLGAKGTTLGGDDGIAVAMTLAILEDNSLPHPPLEAVFTTDEETGMYGAEGLDTSDLKGKILLNADSECEGVLTVSCAGGARVQMRIPLQKQENSAPCKKLIFSGLKGGHSGVEIDKGRINADILLGHFLKKLPQEAYVVSLFGGTKDNAIPARAECVLATREDLSPLIEEFISANRPESDSGLTVEAVDALPANQCYDRASTQRIADFLTTVPNGIQAMSTKIEGLVETSLNLGQLKTEESVLSVTFSVRSSVNRDKLALIDRLQACCTSFGGTFESHGHYPAWEYKEDSRLRETMVKVYRDLHGKDPVVEAIHAGLECGFFCEKIPGLDAVSFGPDMRDIHTPRERLSLASVERTYRYLCTILKEL